MDITNLFKACIKTVRTTNKALGVNNPKTNILRNTPRDPNLAKAKEILKQISSFKNFFVENKAAYLNVLNYLSTSKSMNDIDREQVDVLAEDIVRSCTNLIKEYKKEINNIKKGKQGEEHYNSVIDSLEVYLKRVSKIYTEAKAIRVKRVIEIHGLSKLTSTPTKTTSKENDDKPSRNTENKRYIIPQSNSTPNLEEELSMEEMQMFESENEVLYNELNSMSDEVKQMESKVVHIAELQELFTEKVLQQQGDIERIANIVMSSTEHIQDANQQIRQATQRNAGLRAWVLFFLIVMSFSLLFLDWYND